MNSCNFADWELTCLLPENATHKNSMFLYFFNKKVHLKNHNWYKHVEKINKNIVKTAWTWEDIRLYLKSKNLSFAIWEYDRESCDKDNRPEGYFGFIILTRGINYSSVVECEWFSSYEETRIGAIKYCLNLIKKENE